MSTKIYNIVDENFINSFHPKHIEFMKTLYYEKYLDFCSVKGNKPLSKNDFFTNMRRRKIKLLQICCPYCGNTEIIPLDQTLDILDQFNYCFNCGKSTASQNAQTQLSSIIRMRFMNSIGVKQAIEQYSDRDISLMSYEVYHHELILLSSILEVILRNFFESLVYIKYHSEKNDYISNVIHKSTGNDFMHFDKANNHYKRALSINLKELVSSDCRDNLIDMINIRNTLIHNNGMADKKFKETNTFGRISNCLQGELIFLTPKEIDLYYLSIAEICDGLIKLFDETYLKEKHKLIASRYFNNV
ncbi:MAG: hypothetical protein IKL51_11140 [Lachnospiraceae bacterium]|nr:hypothetical protein [Lachnospiraceae bacterium]